MLDILKLNIWGKRPAYHEEAYWSDVIFRLMHTVFCDVADQNEGFEKLYKCEGGLCSGPLGDDGVQKQLRLNGYINLSGDSMYPPGSGVPINGRLAAIKDGFEYYEYKIRLWNKDLQYTYDELCKAGSMLTKALRARGVGYAMFKIESLSMGDEDRKPYSYGEDDLEQPHRRRVLIDESLVSLDEYHGRETLSAL